MKKLFSLTIMVVCIFALVGCSCSSKNNSSNSTNSNSSNVTNSSANAVSNEPSTVAPDCKIDYGQSTKYNQKDMDDAIDVIKKEFTSWLGGCVLHSISYSSDAECDTADNIKWMNELAKEKNINDKMTQCIMFKSNFHSPVNGGGAWEPDKEYTDYQWWLARTDGGEWKLMTNGY